MNKRYSPHNQNTVPVLDQDGNPTRAQRILRQLRQPLASATHLNRLMPLLRERLADTGLPVAEHDAVATAATRGRLGIPKSHVNDAACLGEPTTILNLPHLITEVRHVGQGNRRMLSTPSRYGTPRYLDGPRGVNSPYRAYCRMLRDQQGYTTMPGHKRRQRRARGLTTGDLVRYNHPQDGLCQGCVTVGWNLLRSNSCCCYLMARRARQVPR